MFKKKESKELTEEQQDLMRLLVGTVTQAESIFEVLDKTTEDEVKRYNLRTSFLAVMSHSLGIKTKVAEIVIDELIKGLKK